MTKKINSIQYYQGVLLFCLFFITLFTSKVFAQDLENKTGQNIVFSSTVLSIAANVSSERLSISYNGLSTGSGYLFRSDTYDLESSGLPGSAVNKFDEEKAPLQFDKKLKQMAQYFFKYFNVDDVSTDDDDSKFLLTGKVNTSPMDSNQMNPEDFEFNLSFNVGYDDGTILKMNAIKLASYWHHTFVNAVYHPEKKEVEFGLSSAYINNCLGDGMKLEFQANPGAGSGAVLLTMNL